MKNKYKRYEKQEGKIGNRTTEFWIKQEQMLYNVTVLDG